ncbi:MAG: hypothetical protein AB7O66_13630 [Limisphaerales bacterium]
MKTDTWRIEISDAGAKATIVVLCTAVAIALAFVTTRANETESTGRAESAAHRAASSEARADAAEAAVDVPRDTTGLEPVANAGPAGMTAAQDPEPEPLESKPPRVSLTDLSQRLDGGLDDLVGSIQSRKGFDNTRTAGRTLRGARPSP